MKEGQRGSQYGAVGAVRVVADAILRSNIALADNQTIDDSYQQIREGRSIRTILN